MHWDHATVYLSSNETRDVGHGGTRATGGAIGATIGLLAGGGAGAPVGGTAIGALLASIGADPRRCAPRTPPVHPDHALVWLAMGDRYRLPPVQVLMVIFDAVIAAGRHSSSPGSSHASAPPNRFPPP
jgi:hypothetical protein